MGPSVLMSYASVTLLTLLFDPAHSDSNATALVPQSNSQRRTVKLYSGIKRDPITCIREGFLADPIDCVTFYQCVLGRRGKYTIFRYQCGPGTVYDPDTEICNHPKNTKRLECRGSTILPSSRDKDNEIVESYQEHINEGTEIIDTTVTTAKDLVTLSNSYPWVSDIVKTKATDVPYIIETTKIPLSINKRDQNIANIKVTSPTTMKQNKTLVKDTKNIFHNPKNFVHNTEALDTFNNKGFTTSNSTKTSKHSISHTFNLKSDDVCGSEGFVGDIINCRKFYRCVSNSRGGYIRYEFFCSDSTIWDDEVQVCNHPQSVKRTRCHAHNTDQIITTAPENYLNKIHDYGSKVTRLTQVTPNLSQNISINRNQTPYNISNKMNKKENAKDHQYQIHQTSNSIILDQRNKIEVTNNEKHQLIQTSIPTDQTMKPSKMSTQMYAITKSTPTAIHHEADNVDKQFSDGNNNKCTKTGFMGDSNNCKIFYRCVENGRGSFTKYEFTCSQGTVWDPQLDACNHEWAVKECGGKAINTISTTQKALITLSPTQHHQTTTESVSNEINHNTLYENQNESPHYVKTTAKTTTTKVSTKSVTTTTESTNKNSKTCTTDGFLGDLNDCKTFYRCVDNGKGGYTKYEYKCGEGTLWDSSINSCNHAWAVKSCNKSPSINMNNIEMTNNHDNSITTTVSPIQSTAMKPQYDDDRYNSSYSQEQIYEVQSTTIKYISKTSTTAKQSLQHSGNNCIRSGFMGDESDCKKFYRCVDNGKGTYTRYEYSCGEGTVWDPMIDSCNHEWAVEKCGGKPISNYDEVEVTSQSSTYMSQKTDPEQNSTENHIQATTSIFSSTTKPINADDKKSECESSGFFGYTNDCTKFYRCVDNDKGGFYRYEFSCGEGTVWDSSLQSCNHKWAVKDCHNDNSQQIQSSSTTLPSSLSSTNSQQANNQEVSHTSTEKTTTEETGTTQSNVCNKEGFARDPRNCKKFYRCVDNGKGNFTKYEFTCGDGTIWNQDIQACDHASKNISCSQEYNNSSSTNSNKENDEMFTETTTKTSTTTLKMNITTTMKPQTGSNSCKSEGYFSDINDCKKFYRCVDNSQGSYIKYDFVCGEGTIWDQEIQGCNHDTGNKKCSKADTENETSVTQSQIETTTKMHNYGTSTSKKPNTSSTPKYGTHNSTTNDQCSSEGFYANSKDCMKFFRCVNNGKGGYTKYDFTCGEGTVWVQEIQACDHDEDGSSCSRNNVPNATQQTPSMVTQQPSETNMPAKPAIEDEQEQPTTQKSSSLQPVTETSKPNENNTCDQEGYFGNKNDCKMFYRCVDNGKGGFTKYDYICGEGTIWDQDVTTCNHPQSVIKPSCKSQNSNSASQTPSGAGSTSETTTVTSSTPESNGVSESSGTSSQPDENSSKNPENQNITCNKAGFYANPNDCKKFYRCVDWDDNGNRFSVYHFECGDGTIWDPALETCNHEESVYPPRNCSKNHSEGEPTTENTTAESTTSTTKEPSTTTTTTKSPSTTTTTKIPSTTTTTTKSPSTTTTTKKPSTTTTTTKSPSTTTTTKIPSTTTTTTKSPSTTTTTKKPSTTTTTTKSPSTTTTTKNPSTTTSTKNPSTTTTTKKPASTTTTTKKPTSQQSTAGSTAKTTENPTTKPASTQQSTTTKKPTTSTSTTTKSPSTQQSTTTESTTTQQTTTNEPTTTEQSTTTKSPTTQQSTTDNPTTTQPSTETTTEPSTTSESSTTQQSTTTEQTTSEASTTTNEQTTTETTTTTTESSTTQQSTTSEQTTTELSTTEENTTESATDSSETTTQESTTEQSTEDQSSSTTESSQSSKCPETDEDQNLFVCPTSFKRHPKYCNIFYQCTEEDDTHEPKIAVFHCPNNTIYDESKNQCLEEGKVENKCDGEIAERRRFKRLNFKSKDPVVVDKSKRSCVAVGHFPFETNYECSPAFLKCGKTKNGMLTGFVHQCPPGYLYWTISRRCEKELTVRDCKRSNNNWSGHWAIPVEKQI